MQKKLRLLTWLSVLIVLCAFSFACSKQQKAQVAPAAPQKELVLAGDIYPPFVYVNDEGEVAGIDIDLMKEACKRLGYKPVYKIIPWNNKDALLANGEFDGLWSCFTMEGLENNYAWAGPYLQTRHVVVVGKHSNIKRFADLEGRRVIVQYSSHPERVLMNQSDPTVPKVRDLYSTNNVDALFSALQMGYADATVCNELVAKQYQEMFPKDFVVLEDAYMPVSLGVAFAKGQTDLSSRFQTALQQMQQDGTTAAIVKRYEGVKNKVGGVNGSAANRNKIFNVSQK